MLAAATNSTYPGIVLHAGGNHFSAFSFFAQGRSEWELTVARLMAAAGLRAKAVRRYRAKMALHHRYARHPNLLWKTAVTTTNQVWVGDITCFKVAGCWWYLAIVMDQYSRRVLATGRGPGNNARAESFRHSQGGTVARLPR